MNLTPLIAWSERAGKETIKYFYDDNGALIAKIIDSENGTSAGTKPKVKSDDHSKLSFQNLSQTDIWNSELFNRLRIQHLEGRRKNHPVCSKCGQLTHCLADNIDAYRSDLLFKFIAYVNNSKTLTNGL